MKLENRIKNDLQKIGLRVDFDLDIRGFSSRLDGTYDPNKSKVVIYASNRDGSLRDYEIIMEIVIHEAVHHLQWKHDPTFVRVKGIMHNANFWKYYNIFNDRWEMLNEEFSVQANEHTGAICNSNSEVFNENMGRLSRIFI